MICPKNRMDSCNNKVTNAKTNSEPVAKTCPRQSAFAYFSKGVLCYCSSATLLYWLHLCAAVSPEASN